MKKQCYLIDIFKLFFCFCVVAIHTSLLKNFSDESSFWILQLIFRLAVPFFLITSGFMLGCKLVPVENDCLLSWEVVKKYCIRQLKLLIVFELITLCLNAIFDLIDGVSLAHVFLKSVREIIFYPRGALWFLQACIIGSLLYYLFVRLGAKKMIFPVSITLYFFALMCNSYSFLVPDNSCLQKIVDTYLYVCLSSRNGLFVGFLYIALGIYCCKLKNKDIFFLKKYYATFFCVLSFILYVGELVVLKSCGAYPGKEDFSLFIALPIFICFLVCFLSHFVKEKSAPIVYCRNLSTGIYLLHSPISLLVYRSFRLYEWYDCKTLVFLLVSSIAALVCVIAYKCNGIASRYLK